MRRTASFAFLSVTVPALLALPVTAPAPPEARPVAPKFQTLEVDGLDVVAAADVTRGRPVALTGQRGTDPFSLVGVSWRDDSAPDDTRVEVRVRSGGRWSDWTVLELMDEGPDDVSAEAAAAGHRGGTEPLWVGDSDGVQVRVDSVSAVAPRDLQINLVDPGESPADADLGRSTGPRDTASATTPKPAIISRAQWGADESLRSGSPSYASTVKAAYVHHTASTNDYTQEQAAAQVRSFYAYHTKSLGWSDIGYNFLVDRFGRIYEGRHGGIDRAVIGAHAGGFNTATVGISMIGTHSTVAPTTATLNSLNRLLAWRLSKYGRDPMGTTVLTSGGGSSSKHAAGTQVRVPVIVGHRDTNSTACPGDAGYSRLPGVRTAVRDIIATEDGSPIDTKHAMLGGDDGILGAATAPEQVVGKGRYRSYERGNIYWSSATGAREVHGEILTRYVALGGPSSVLGFPTTDETAVKGGRANTFQGGVMFWSPSTRAIEVYGLIAKRWTALGRESGTLGTPTHEELPTSDGAGRYSQFTGGWIFWTAATGAWPVQGAIRTAWARLGREGSAVGYPTTEERGTPDGRGRFNHFQRGSVYWTAATEAHEVRGAIKGRWARLGWETGPLGYPVTDELVVPNGTGRFNLFEGGSVYWSPASGAHEVRGAIRAQWGRLGWEAGRLGYPVSDEYAVIGGRRGDFQGGSITWTAVTGATTVRYNS